MKNGVELERKYVAIEKRLAKEIREIESMIFLPARRRSGQLVAAEAGVTVPW